MSQITIENVSRYFGKTTALKQVNLEVNEGEFFSLLGPSGCGKTTLLNIIAGFLDPSSGRIQIGGQDVTHLPPYHRRLGMVFQNYALFPHLSVFDNVAYGLKIQKMTKEQIRKRVMEYLSLVQLDSYAQRMPHQLSGGQQQRVAISRALVVQPTVLLLDEPLSNLDAKLRKDMQTELRNIQQRVGITTILVTHDQEEALSLSDRIGILGHGQLQQVDTPLTVYRRPANRFVAEFIGQVNLFEVTAAPGIVHTGTNLTWQATNYRVSVDQPLILTTSNQPNFNEHSSGLLMLRPERIHVSFQDQPEQPNQISGNVSHVSYVGNALRLQVSLNGQGTLYVHVPDEIFAIPPQIGQSLYLSWKAEDLIPLEQEEWIS
jgi:putative spermidine/putrescine transport system ATP-binding protein